MIKNNVIIVAGGKGLRMGTDLPKQFIPIGGRPILMHTIQNFYDYDQAINIILVLPQSHQGYWADLCEEYKFTVPHTIAIGGEARFHSVNNGLEFVHEGLVAVQDGVRPFGSIALISRCFEAAAIHKAIIPVVPSIDSLREVSAGGRSRIVDRANIRLIQTPQVFDAILLKKAYESGFKDSYTDDASVVEAMGTDIHLVEGEVTNIKITTSFDLQIGEVIYNGKCGISE